MIEIVRDVHFPPKLEFLFRPARYKVLYGGRGGAKSWGVARALLILAAQRPMRVLCARETQRSIAESVHQLLKDQISLLGLDDYYVVTDAMISGPNGSQFTFAGLRQHNVTSIKSYEGVDVCWVEEAQTVSKRSWEILVPTIRKEGSEIWVTFNPELDTDETYQRFVVSPPESAKVVKVNWSDNPWFPATLESERQALLRRDPEMHRYIYEGEARTIVEGAIYRHEIPALLEQGRFRDVPHDPLLRVHVVWDLGWNDATAIIMVQRAGSELRIIDYLEDSHRPLDWYSHELRQREYNWGTCYLPHDARAANIGSGRSPQEIMQSLGWSVQIVPQLSVEDGIAAARLALPRSYFDKTTTVRLIECLKRYRRNVPTTTGEPSQPLHDEYSHGADAYRYLAIVADGLSNDDWGGKLIYPTLVRWHA